MLAAAAALSPPRNPGLDIQTRKSKKELNFDMKNHNEKGVQ
jgi:hypothetical protein